MSNWYWGKYVTEPLQFTKRKDYEEYVEEQHGWHHSEEWKREQAEAKEVEAELALLENPPPTPEQVRDCAEAIAVIQFGPTEREAAQIRRMRELLEPRSVEVDCDFCSNCRDHAGFTRNEDGETVSDCCGASPFSVDEDYGGDR